MYKLKYADYPGNFHSFTLKEGYFYGQDTKTGQYIATSGWECAGNVAIYFLESGKWEMHWIDIDADFQVENLPVISMDDKMSFIKWLEEEQGISPEDWDENYSGEMAKQIEEGYESYLYDGLPRFVVKQFKEEETNMENKKIIMQAYEDSLRNTNMRFVVYKNQKTGDFYQFSDIAGGNSEPESAWNGTDEKICEFCFQHWSPEDGDDMFRENLISYLTKEQKEQVKAREEEEECEIPGEKVAEMFSDQYKEYCEGIIENMLSEFDVEEYIN